MGGRWAGQGGAQTGVERKDSSSRYVALHSVNQRVKYILVCVVQFTYCIYIHNTLQVLLAIVNKGSLAIVNKGRVAMIINTLKG